MECSIGVVWAQDQEKPAMGIWPRGKCLKGKMSSPESSEGFIDDDEGGVLKQQAICCA
jgi:hypothetical protein